MKTAARKLFKEVLREGIYNDLKGETKQDNIDSLKDIITICQEILAEIENEN